HVERDGLIEAIQACWQSAQAARVQAYGTAGQLAVLVQHMVDSVTSGVTFSVNPVTGNRDEVMIEAIYGLCEPLVQGIATPDNYILDQRTGRVPAQDIARKSSQLGYRQGRISETPILGTAQTQPALLPEQLDEVT